MNNTFSLILSTYGRYDELQRFVQSLMDQDLDLKNVELIIVDQNDKIDLKPIIRNYNDKLKIIHLQPSFRGLSVCRNEGLKHSSGDIIAFPDDDCTYYSDTLSVVNHLANEKPEVDVFIGKIYDRVNEKNIIRNWKTKEFSINIRNFFPHYASITIFSRKKDIKFDLNMGVGTRFGSCEDADYVVEALKKNYNVHYYPRIEVWHPDLIPTKMDLDKVYSYGLGFGALCKKHNSPRFFIMMVFVIMYHFLMMIGNVFIFNFKGIRKRRASIISRIKGYKNYEN